MKAERYFSFHWFSGLLLFSICSITTTWAVQPYKPQISDPLLEPWRWHHIPELSGKGIRCMVEAKDGSMWFGTKPEVLQYDGLHWIPSTMGDSLPGETVLGLLSSQDGKIYAVTPQGIRRFEEGRWDKIFSWATVPSYVYNWRVDCFIETSDGSIWAGLPYGALRIQGSKFIFYTTQTLRDSVKKSAPGVEISLVPEKITNHIESFKIYSLFEDREGNLWFGFYDGEILRYNPPNNWRLMHRTDQKPHINQTRDGEIWIISGSDRLEQSGPWIYDSASDAGWYHIDLRSIGGNHLNYSFLQTRDGAIWIGGFERIHIFKNGKWHIYKSSNLPISLFLRMYFYESSDGTVWIYVPHKDVYRGEYADSRWITYRGLNFQFETKNHSKWFISVDNGVVCQNNGEWIRYGTEDGLMDAPNSLSVTRNEQIWASGSHRHNAATAYFDGKKWHKKVHDKVSWSIDYRIAFEAFDGTLYFSAAGNLMSKRGDKGGLLRYDPFEKDSTKAWIHIDPSIVRHTNFYGIGQTADSTLWLGRNSLIKFDGKRYTESVNHDILSGAYIECIENSENDHLWVGTRRYGVFYYNDKDWENYTVENSGLASNTIVSLLPTSDTTVWVATDKDICYFDGKEWETYLFPEQMTMVREGGTLKMSHDGTLWINRSSQYWFARAHPGKILTKEILSDYWTVAYHPDRLAPETEITMGEKKVSQPGNIIIKWRGMDSWMMTPDAKLQYSYRLDNGAWSPFGFETSHVFLSLGSGKHTFEVKARDSDFNTDPTPARVQFTVLPPLWRHPFVITIASVFGLVVLLLEVNILRRNKKLQEMNRMIKVSLSEKEVLLKEIHHRVKNNLQVICSLIMLQSQHIKSKRALKMFQDSQDRVRSMAMVHEKLYQSDDLSKINFADYVQSLVDSLYRSYKVNPERIGLEIEVKNVSLNIDLAVPCGLIINELVSNTLKYAFPPTWKGSGKIRISFSRTEDNEVELIIYDNGVGLPESIDLKYSDSFGLHLVNILVKDQLQGEITLDRKNGTKFRMRFRG